MSTPPGPEIRNPPPEMPEQFKEGLWHFGGWIEDLVSSLDDLVSLFLSDMDEKDAAGLRPYVTELLNGKYSDEELQEIWLESPAPIRFFGTKDVRTFLTALLARINKPPYLSGPEAGAESAK